MGILRAHFNRCRQGKKTTLCVRVCFASISKNRVAADGVTMKSSTTRFSSKNNAYKSFGQIVKKKRRNIDARAAVIIYWQHRKWFRTFDVFSPSQLVHDYVFKIFLFFHFFSRTVLSFIFLANSLSFPSIPVFRTIVDDVCRRSDTC